MNTHDLAETLGTLFGELLEGPPGREAYMLNPEDPGLHRSLDRLSAEEASRVVHGGASIAAHVDHLNYGFSLMNRWAGGENPFRDADWTASWRRTAVTDEEWARLRAELREQTRRWQEVAANPREVNRMELNGIVGSLAHLAYHVGAIRQMNRAARGPSADD